MKLLEYEDMDVQREYISQMYSIVMNDIGIIRQIQTIKKQLEDSLDLSCDMYRICPNYESVCSSIQYRDNCRKKEESYWKGENNGNE